MKIAKIILSIVTMLFALLGLLRIIPFDITNPIMFLALATLLVLRSIEYNHPDHIGIVSELMKQGVKLLLLDTQRPYIHFADEIFSRDKRLDYEPINVDGATIHGLQSQNDFLCTCKRKEDIMKGKVWIIVFY